MKAYEELGFAKLDHDRVRRKGFPEVIFCHGKTVEQVRRIFKAMESKNDTVLLTRINEKQYKEVKKLNKDIMYNRIARIAFLRPKQKKGKIVVITGGTADIPVAEEAAVTAEVMGKHVERIFDAGVAGIHRLLSHEDRIKDADAVVAVAGMEGALASVVAGLTPAPVIAVPTSVGYGASFKGLSALLTMLNSCSPGVAVVNIDNGFGAGYFASLIQ